MLRWFQPQFAWVCDRCRSIYASSPQPGAMRTVLVPATAVAAPGAAGAVGLAPPPAGVLVGGGMIAARPNRPAFALPSRRVMLLVGGAAGLIIASLLVWFLVLGKKTATGAAKDRDELVTRAVAALAAHDADALMSLSDYESLRETMLDCEDSDRARRDRERNRREMQENFEKEIERTRKATLELGSLERAKDPDDSYNSYSYNADAPTRLSRGDSAGDDCRFKVEAAFHNIEFTIKVTVDGKTREQPATLMALEVEDQWHLISPPRIEGELGTSDCRGAVANAMKLSRDEMLKLPNMTETKLDSLKYDITDLCEEDRWEEDVRMCLSDALISSAVESCMRKLSSSQMSNVTSKIMRAAEY
jgi:hypothetical protein